MAHYAKVHNGIVEQVIVADALFFDSYLDSSPGEWVQTSYNTYANVHQLGGTPLRKNYATVGGSYDGVGFYDRQPYSSWTLNSTTYCWEPPVAHPSDGKDYQWDETSKSWKEIT